MSYKLFLIFVFCACVKMRMKLYISLFSLFSKVTLLRYLCPGQEHSVNWLAVMITHGYLNITSLLFVCFCVTSYDCLFEHVDCPSYICLCRCTNMYDHIFTSCSDLLVSFVDQTSIGWTIVAFILPFWRGVMKSFLWPVSGMMPHSFTSSVIYVLLELKGWTVFPTLPKIMRTTHQFSHI